MSIDPGLRGLSPLECLCALGTLWLLVLIAAVPTHRTLTKARIQAHTIRHWDAHQAALAEVMASGTFWKVGNDATSAK